MTENERYSRNEALFGRAGQNKIAAARVAIVGTGGLGSHIAQQLSYLGVLNRVLVDPDIVTISSLNRMIGALPGDAASGEYKARVVARMCKAVLRGGDIVPITTPLTDPAAKEAIANCTSVFGCLDEDAARLDLTALCCTNNIPLFDLATDIERDGDTARYGGRVLFTGNGERCPVCMDLLDQNALARSAMSDDQFDVDMRIYGVRGDDLAGSGPAVIGLNGVVASLAVMEWTVWTTGIREPLPLLEYRGAEGGVFVGRDEPRPDCYYCAMWRNTHDGDAA